VTLLRPACAACLILLVTACDKETQPPPTTAPNAVEATDEPAPAEDPGPADESTEPAQSDEGETGEDDGGVDLGPPATSAPDGPVEIPDDPAEGLTEPTSFASVKVEVKTPGGEVVRDEARIIRWDQPTRIPVDVSGKEHEFTLDIHRDGKKVSLKITYVVDGTDVLREQPLDSKLGKRDVLRIDDGTALAFTVANKTIKPKAPSQKKIDNPEGNDPLTGVPESGIKKKKKK
jgi:hypothetical protein